MTSESMTDVRVSRRGFIANGSNTNEWEEIGPGCSINAIISYQDLCQVCEDPINM